MNTESTESSKMIDSPKEKAEEVKKLTCIEYLKETVSDQDFKQKIGMYIAFITEFYRALMGSFLVVFVPQKC